jgi:hypothetical protein
MLRQLNDRLGYPDMKHFGANDDARTPFIDGCQLLIPLTHVTRKTG